MSNIERIEITRTADGYAVTMYEPRRKMFPVTVLATVCGGNLGKRLAAMVAAEVAQSKMIDVVELYLDEDLFTGICRGGPLDGQEHSAPHQQFKAEGGTYRHAVNGAAWSWHGETVTHDFAANA